MTVSSAANLALLHATRRVQQLAAEGDVDGLHDELCELRNALVEELSDDEDQGCARTSETVCRLARHGQRQLLRFVNELLDTTAEPDQDDCACLLRSAELRALLVRQVRLQTQVRARHPRVR